MSAAGVVKQAMLRCCSKSEVRTAARYTNLTLVGFVNVLCTHCLALN
jgi:hypothetical protein